MAMDLWFREDVTRILASTYDAMQASTRAASTEDSGEMGLYRQGFTDALRAVAVAFGVGTPNPSGGLGQPRTGRLPTQWVEHLPPRTADSPRFPQE
jgi:hypothetical protein